MNEFESTPDGDDQIWGGDETAADQLIWGGAGSDRIWTGGMVGGAVTVYGDSTDSDDDFKMDTDTDNEFDGDDLIDVGDDNAIVKVYGQSGNDKIIGGTDHGTGATQVDKLYGGSGDDKIWAVNPGQDDSAMDMPGKNFLYGGDGDDWLYGAQGKDAIYGDFKDVDPATITVEDALGGDDKIKAGDADDMVFGGYGHDKIYGDGGADKLYGNLGDDTIWGGDGDDFIYGDDKNIMAIVKGPVPVNVQGTGLHYGKDKLYGGDGIDKIYGGALQDKIHGGEGADMLYGDAGDDTIWGDEGEDIIVAGTGWDTVFGGAGCDLIYTYDGGDVVWLGACEEETAQKVYIYGTGTDPENYTVIMDFWLEGARPYNSLCVGADPQQAAPTAAPCAAPVADRCLSAAHLF